MRYIVHLCLLLTLNSVEFFVFSTGHVESCPTLCFCDVWYGLQRASCTGRHLYSIHTGAPNDIQALDLSNNSISTLNNFEILDAGLKKLKYLNLSGNAIGQIALNAFSGLADLSVLDLSNNHLYYILGNTFVENTNLRVLKLSRNNFNLHVPKLRSPLLTDLSLDHCQISHLPTDVFNGLGQLRNLDLSNNLMIQLDSIVLQALRFLRQLLLDGNPWSCNKLMYDLQTSLERKNVNFNKVCGKTTGPKKFEKMILLEPRKNLERISSLDKEIAKTQAAPKSKSPTANQKNANQDILTNVDVKNDDVNFAPNGISPYFFFIAGFVLGSACSLVISYIWMSRTFQRCCTRRERACDDPQRVSLLQNLWQVDDSVGNTDRSQSVCCPGTPPPPYREVMLRPEIYLYSAGASNSTTSDIRRNVLYT